MILDKKRITALVLAIMLTATCANALEIVTDYEALYESGRALYDVGQYQDAIEYFIEAGKYKDSVFWCEYCKAIVNIEQGDLYSASIRFEKLAKSKFMLSEEWKQYCLAREYEKEELYNAALTIYTEINVHDSFDRYFKLKLMLDGKLNVEDDVKNLPAPMKVAVKAKLNKAETLYYGPGKSFTKVPQTLSADYSILIYEQERDSASRENWGLIEFEADGMKYRAYASMASVNPEAVVKQITVAPIKQELLKRAVSVFYGPGVDYAVYSEPLPIGTMVSVLGFEGEYAHVEYQLSNSQTRTRAYISSNYIQKQ